MSILEARSTKSVKENKSTPLPPPENVDSKIKPFENYWLISEHESELLLWAIWVPKVGSRQRSEGVLVER